MKTKIMKTPKAIAFTAIIFFAACSTETPQSVDVNSSEKVKPDQDTTADIVDVSFVDEMTGKAFQDYLKIEEALFNSDLSVATKSAANLAETFTTDQAELKALANKMAESEELETLRTHFFSFSKQSEDFFSDALSTGTIYKQYCPMAFDNEGAFWIAEIKEINNPYFGERMAHCGKTVEVISK
jgi:hypothetical protein